jgi:hypothetical protein
VATNKLLNRVVVAVYTVICIIICLPKLLSGTYMDMEEKFLLVTVAEVKLGFRCSLFSFHFHTLFICVPCLTVTVFVLD